jgi:hypothetical protein
MAADVSPPFPAASLTWAQNYEKYLFFSTKNSFYTIFFTKKANFSVFLLFF